MISSINGRTTQKCIGKSNKHWLVIWKVSVCQYKGSHLKKNRRISDHCCALLIVSLAITVISRVRPSVPIKHEQSSNAGQHYPFFAILPLFSQIYPQHFASLGLFKFVTHAQICDQIALNSHFALINDYANISCPENCVRCTPLSITRVNLAGWEISQFCQGWLPFLTETCSKGGGYWELVPIYPRNNTIIESIVQGGVYMNMGKPSLDIITSMGEGSSSMLRISFIISSNFSEMFRIFTTLGVLFISNCILFSAGSKIPG